MHPEILSNINFIKSVRPTLTKYTQDFLDAKRAETEVWTKIEEAKQLKELQEADLLEQALTESSDTKRTSKFKQLKQTDVEYQKNLKQLLALEGELRLKEAETRAVGMRQRAVDRQLDCTTEILRIYRFEIERENKHEHV